MRWRDLIVLKLLFYAGAAVVLILAFALLVGRGG